MTIISFLSDFGYKDPYVAQMKAIILTINPRAQIVDVSHKIKKFDIKMGAYVLASVTPYFPTNTIHVSVVDPGVGTERRPIIVETNHSIYVGPDNGLNMLAAHKECITNVYVICNPEYMRTKISKTFHGRDIFAPVAAHLSKGIKPSDFGPSINDYVFPEFAKPQRKNTHLVGEVLHIDDFGNIITNISAEDLEQYGINYGISLLVKLNNKTFNIKFCSTYGEVSVGTPLALIGSSNFFEVAFNQRNASEVIKPEVGDKLSVSMETSCGHNSVFHNQ